MLPTFAGVELSHFPVDRNHMWGAGTSDDRRPKDCPQGPRDDLEAEDERRPGPVFKSPDPVFSACGHPVTDLCMTGANKI